MNPFYMHHPGHYLAIRDIGQSAIEAFKKTMTSSNIQSGLRKPCIFPFDKHAFSDVDFAPASISEKANVTKNNISADMNISPGTSKMLAESSVPLRKKKYLIQQMRLSNVLHQ